MRFVFALLLLSCTSLLVVPASATPAKSSKVRTPGDMAIGQKVLQIGAIIDASESKHFEMQLEKLVEIAARTEIDLGTIYRMNDEDLYLSPGGRKTAQLAWVFFAKFVSGIDLPTQYKAVKTSPTWILITKEGEILIEGTKKLEQFIDSKGRFKKNILTRS